MTPLSHTTHTAPAAPEQAGDTVITQIGDLPNDVFVPNIFSYLGPQELSRARLVCQRFNVFGRTTWQRRAQELCQACSKSLASFGITPLRPNSSQEEDAIFLRDTTLRIKQINESLPENLRLPFSANDLVCKVGLGHMQEFLQKAYDHSLRTMFGELAHVPEGSSLEESVRLIKDWLQTAEAGQIRELNLDRLGLCCLPQEIGQLTALQRLNLRDNQLRSLPLEIERLTALQWLNMSNNRLDSLPPEIGRLTALDTLWLDGNQLKTLPREIGQLTALQKLGLVYNHLTSLPPEIGQLTALHWLSLIFNRLASLPPEVGQLTALRWLHLDGNQFKSLPPEIGQLTALRTLDLSRNQLASLPPEIGQLTALNELDLNENQFTSLPREIGQLTALRNLFLERNPCTIPPEAIERLKARNARCLVRL